MREFVSGSKEDGSESGPEADTRAHRAADTRTPVKRHRYMNTKKVAFESIVEVRR